MPSEPATVTVIIPALNEAETIAPLLRRLLDGTRRPDEIVVADGGSIDESRTIVESFSTEGVRLVEGPGGISENRNAAISAATSEVIACTDAGCIPDPEWLERITEPFDSGARWVAGLSRPAARRPLQRAIGLAMMPVPEEVDVEGFVPGGASQAFLKSVWEQVGGFPEGMAAGEDTLFGARLTELGIRPVVVPDAQVEWLAPTSIAEMLSKAFRWGAADGAVGNGERSYLSLTLGPALLGGAAVVQLLRRRWSALLPLSLLTGWSLSVVRHRLPYIASPPHRALLPFLHSMRSITQTIGWWTGFVRNPRREPLVSYGRKATALALSRVKAAIRPFVPDSIVVRLRSGHGGGHRQNVDVLVDDPDEIDRWLEATPDTYRVGILPETSTPPPELVFIPPDLPEPHRRRLERAFHAPDVEAAVAALTSPPRIDLGRVNEPQVDPVAVAVDPRALPGPLPIDPSTAAHVIRQAGLHQALVPFEGLPPAASRRPISGQGAVVICGTIPMHDVGGGARGPQMAHELVARGYHVTYLHLFDSDETVDLGLRYIHPALDQIALEGFEFDRYLDRLHVDDRLAVIELPHPRFFPLVTELRAAGFRVVYDLMDDWSDTGLGGWGYRPEDELETIRRSDGLVASAPSLVERLEQMSDRPVALVPNAVNVRIFHPQETEPPADLPSGDGPVIEYHGSLYGDWFDWDALRAAAEQHQSARFVIIGDARRHPEMPNNVHFLGLKPQHLLPGYLAHTDVAIIPFEVSETTHSVSPLKVFEYLAMGVPVASTPIAPVIGLVGVFTDPDLGAAISAALQAPRPDPSAAAEQHGWGDRLARFFETVDLELGEDPDAEPIGISQHATHRWTQDQRRL